MLFFDEVCTRQLSLEVELITLAAF